MISRPRSFVSAAIRTANAVIIRAAYKASRIIENGMIKNEFGMPRIMEANPRNGGKGRGQTAEKGKRGRASRWCCHPVLYWLEKGLPDLPPREML